MSDDKIEVVLYARVSTEIQKEKKSIEAQIEYLINWCEREDMKIVGMYRDDGYSGKDMHRPEMRRLMQDIPKKMFKGILAYHNDRISRNTRDVLDFAQLCAKHKVNLRLGNFDMDTTTPEGEMMFTMLGAFAHYFRRDLGRKTSLGMQKRKRDGKWMGRVSKHFMKGEDGTLYPHQIVFDVYNLHLQGKSLRTIAKKVKIPKSNIPRLLKCYEWWISTDKNPP
jgi:site-specific DNA recombinase